jgi:hypothetical protein
MSSTGAVRGGQTGYNTGIGWWLGHDAGAYKFSFGNPGGDHISFDGTNVSMTGTLNVANLAAVNSSTGALTVSDMLTIGASGKITQTVGVSGMLDIGSLGGGRNGIKLLAGDGTEVLYIDDLGAYRVSGAALPHTADTVAPASPNVGDTWDDTGNDYFRRWNGSAWRILATLGATWGGDVTGIPSNLASLGGSEGILNSGVSINAGGVLSGGGGGTVTIGGLGYTGALNATVGAIWNGAGANVTAIPTGLSAVSGADTVRNALISLSAGGALLGAGGGAVTIGGLGYTGDLDATDGGVWAGAGANITAIPSGLSAVSGSDTVRNALVSISAGGALVGAGGGTVTIAGLGYSGDLNATAGAIWTGAGANVTAIPGHLTDNRITTALNSAGVLQTNIANASQIPSLAAGAITSGTFGVARIPSGLNANLITAGAFADARIPSLNASKITAGSFDVARIPSGLNANLVTTGTFGADRIATDAIVNSKVDDTAGIQSHKIEFPVKSDGLSSDLTINTTDNWVNVCEVSFTNVGVPNFVFFNGSRLAFPTTADASDHGGNVLHWTIRESSIAGRTDGTIICSGTVTFDDPAPDPGNIEVLLNDFAEIAIKDGPYDLAGTGTVYVALVVDIGVAGGTQVYLEGDAVNTFLNATGFGILR